MTRLLYSAAFILALTSCNSNSAPDARSTAAATAATTIKGTVSATGAVPKKPRSPHAGRWEGSFAAKRAEISVPEGVPDPGWKKDDGTARSGPGKLSLTVADDGSVTGAATGSLGNLVIRGRIDGATLRVGLAPAQPTEDHAMTGFLTGAIAGDAMEATLRASSHDAALPRIATFKLTKQKSK